MGHLLSSLGEGMKNWHGVLTWVAVQGLRMLTAAAGEASRADTRVTAALGIMALAPILAGSVLASRAVGDAMCCEVDIMEDNLLALDAQLTYTAWHGGAGLGEAG